MPKKPSLPTPRIGTAGWSVPSRYLDRLPESGSHLERYARQLNAAEINSSFHRPHRSAVYARWAAATPASFRFSVKLPKTITHERRLSDCEELIARFADEVAGLGEKLAVLLVQLPPSAALNKRRADAFFRRLHRAIATPVVLEPRHASWFTLGLDAWLAERRIARVAADPVPGGVPPEAGAGQPGGWRGLHYYRWHGAPRVYFSDYPIARLQALKREVATARRVGTPVWCIFDNTAGGHALGNALWLTDAISTHRYERRRRIACALSRAAGCSRPSG